MLVMVSHEECEARARGFRNALFKALDKLRDVTADRDEWKQQHENLLAMYRMQTEELAQVRSQLGKPGE